VPTFEGIETKQPSNPLKVIVGNIIVRIYKRRLTIARGKYRAMFDLMPPFWKVLAN
jgi:hypothetical protein